VAALNDVASDALVVGVSCYIQGEALYLHLLAEIDAAQVRLTLPSYRLLAEGGLISANPPGE
jgi:hypothetical protein